MNCPLLLFGAFYPTVRMLISTLLKAVLASSECFRLSMEISQSVGRMLSFNTTSGAGHNREPVFCSYSCLWGQGGESWARVSSCSPGWPGITIKPRLGSNLGPTLNLLPQHPKCCDFRHGPPYLAHNIIIWVSPSIFSTTGLKYIQLCSVKWKFLILISMVETKV